MGRKAVAVDLAAVAQAWGLPRFALLRSDSLEVEMRAFMSDETSLRSRATWRDGAPGACKAACAEARAILAETEPMREGYLIADRKYRGPIYLERFSMSGPTEDACEALAEALAAFVALEPGTRVELHPGLDAWMQGDRYGEVLNARYSNLAGTPRYTVRLDKSGRLLRLPFDRVTPID